MSASYHTLVEKLAFISVLDLYISSPCPFSMLFGFKLVYNVENLDEAKEDLATLAEGFKLLENDYLGGHGSRGYGRVALQDIKLEAVGKTAFDLAGYEALFKD